MNPRQGDDALNWAGDDDPTLQVGEANPAEHEPVQPEPAEPEPAELEPVQLEPVEPDLGHGEPAGLAAGWTVAQPTAAEAKDAHQTDASEPAPTQPDVAEEPAAQSSTALVGMGILGGVYLLYTIGWFIGVSRMTQPIGDPVAEFMFSIGTWLAVAAPLVWFGVTFGLTRHHLRARILWLSAGVVLLAPLPFILGTGVGA